MLCLDHIKLLRKSVLCQDFSTNALFTFIFIYINNINKILVLFFYNLPRKTSTKFKN